VDEFSDSQLASLDAKIRKPLPGAGRPGRMQQLDMMSGPRPSQLPRSAADDPARQAKGFSLPIVQAANPGGRWKITGGIVGAAQNLLGFRNEDVATLVDVLIDGGVDEVSYEKLARRHADRFGLQQTADTRHPPKVDASTPSGAHAILSWLRSKKPSITFFSNFDGPTLMS